MTTAQQISAALIKLKEKQPLVLCLTNLVTINDCANILLALGASPVMSDDLDDARQLVCLASSLCLNIGTIAERQLNIMTACSKKAHSEGIPILLDPVGAGATTVRLEAYRIILDCAPLQLIRGNASEIKALAGEDIVQKGVDASLSESRGVINAAKTVAAKHHCTAAVTGPTDIISNGAQVQLVPGGHPFMTAISGTGCMLSAMSAAYMAVCDDVLIAASAAMLHMALAGEKALASIGEPSRLGQLKTAIFDQVAALSPDELFAAASQRLE